MLYPLFAMVALTALVWSWLYVTRFREVRAKRIPVQELANRAHATRVLQNVSGPSDNLLNLFELPVLFYVAVLLVHVSNRSDGIYLALAWAYVLLRAVHSYIHCTYNLVMHRFVVYLASSMVLWAIWVRLSLQIFASA